MRVVVDGRYAMVGAAIAIPILGWLLALWHRGGPGAIGRSRVISAAFAMTAALLAILAHSFRDEVFLSFRQAQILADHGRYSFQTDGWIDGTNDVLFYVLLAIGSKLGIPVPLGGLLGGALSFGGMVFLVSREAWRRSRSLVATAAAGTMTAGAPSLVILGGSGWSAAFVGLWTVAAMRGWRSDRWRWTFAWLGLLPLVRMDLSYYTILVGAALVWEGSTRMGRDRRALIRSFLAALAGPLVVLMAWRFLYGHFIPTPVVQKLGAPGGFDRLGSALLRDVFTLGADLSMFGPGLLALILFRRRRLTFAAWLIPAAIHEALVCWRGGDDHEGHRYVVILITAIAMLAGAGAARAALVFGLRTKARRPVARSRVALVAACLALGFAASLGPIPDRLKRGVDVATFDWFGNGPAAMARSRLVSHRATTAFFNWLVDRNPSARLGTCELGSIFHEFCGIGVDPLGFIDRHVAEGPRNPHATIGIADSRLDTEIWTRERPDIIWLDTFDVFEPQFTQVPMPESQPDDPGSRVRAALAIFMASRHRWWTAPYLVLPCIGEDYDPCVTTVNDRYRILWFARRTSRAAFDARLKSAGFRHG